MGRKTLLSFSRCLRSLLGFWLVFLWWMPTQVQAVDFDWQLDSGLRFRYTQNGLNLQDFPPTLDQNTLGGSLLLSTMGLVTFTDKIDLTISIDIGEMMFGVQETTQNRLTGIFLNDFPLTLDEAAQQAQKESVAECKLQAQQQRLPSTRCEDPFWLLQEAGFLRELMLTIQFDEIGFVQLEVGSMERSLGSSFVFDAFVLGLRLTVAPWKLQRGVPWKFVLDFFLPSNSWTIDGKQSPVTNLEVSYVHNKQTELTFFITHMVDGDNQAGELLLQLRQEHLSSKLSGDFKKKYTRSPGLSCSGEPDRAAIKASLPQTDRELQDLCEEQNRILQQQGEETLACPVDEVIEQFTRNVCSTLPASSGQHFWVGVKGKGKWGKFSLRGTAILYFSWMQLTLPEPPTLEMLFDPVIEELPPVSLEELSLQGLGFLLELAASYQWTPAWSMTAFFLMSTGDQWDGKRTTLNNFITIAPQARYTNIFFNGGINAYSARRGISIGGVSGRGFVVPGVKVNYNLPQKFTAELTVAAMWSASGSSNFVENSGSLYGVEVNINASYKVLKWLQPVIQVDYFFPGDFFLTPAGRLPAPLFQVQLGLNFSFSSV